MKEASRKTTVPLSPPREDGHISVDTILSHFEALLNEATYGIQDESLIEEITSQTDHLLAFPNQKVHSNMLWAACKHGYALSAMYLSRYCRVDERDLDYGSTPLHFLCKISDCHMENLARSLVECGADPNAVSNGTGSYVDEGCNLVLRGTPLDWAIISGNLRAAQCLIAVGSNPLFSGSEITPLCRAISLFRTDIVRQILEFIGPIEKLNEAEGRLSTTAFEIVYGLGPQMIVEHERAILYGDSIADAARRTLDTVLEFVKEGPTLLDLLLYQTITPDVQYRTAVLVPYLTELLIEKGAAISPRFDVNGVPFLHRFPPLWIREGENCELLLETLLQHYPPVFDLNIRDVGGRTALHEAAIYNAYPLIAILLKHGAQIEAEDTDHCTPLALAGCMASQEAFEILLDHGASIQLQGCNVLHQSCMRRTSSSIIPFALLYSKHRAKFLQKNILEGIMSTVQTTPLGIAIHNSDIEAVKVLLQFGANPRAPYDIPGWGVVISVREAATLLRHRPELSEVIYTWQRREWDGLDKRIADIREVQKILYINCKESDFEEPDSIHVSGGKGSKPFMLLQARQRRQGEWYSEEFVSLDVLSQKPRNVGCSMWEEIDLREEEYVQHRMMMFAPRPGPGEEVSSENKKCSK